MYKLKVKISEHWHITLFCVPRLNMDQRSGAFTQKKKKKKLKWFKGQPDGCQMITLHTVVLRDDERSCNSGWRSLENRRYDAHLTMFYMIVYILHVIAIPVPSHFECPEAYTSLTHTLCLTDRFSLLSVTINSFFSPIILMPSKQKSARSIMHIDSKAYIVFNLSY